MGKSKTRANPPTTVEIYGRKLTCRVKIDEDATNVSSLFLMRKYTDEELLQFLEARPDVYYIEYMSKKDIISGIRNGLIYVTMIDESMFLTKRCNDAEAMILYMRTISSNVMKDNIAADYRRFCKLLLMSRTSK